MSGGILAAVARKARLLASSATRRGEFHAENEDSHLLFPEAGLFCVADGLGGHVDGHLASRAVTRILERAVSPEDGHEERIAGAERALLSLNGALVREAERLTPAGVIGSTVVAVLLEGAEAAVLWAGDSRLYLARAGSLYLLTRDHAADRLVEGRPARVLTRAIGSGPAVAIEQARFEVAAADVLLLCSDGLTAGLSAEAINDLLADPATDAARLVDAAVRAGARDDVTAIHVRLAVDSPGQGH